MKSILLILSLLVSLSLRAADIPPFPLKYCAFNPAFVEGLWVVKSSPGVGIGYVEISVTEIEGLPFMLVELIEYDLNMKMVSSGQGLLSKDKKSISAGMTMLPVEGSSKGGYSIYIRNHCRNNMPGMRTIMTIEPFSGSKVLRTVVEIERVDNTIEVTPDINELINSEKH